MVVMANKSSGSKSARSQMTNSATPAMRQYHEIRRQAQDAILFFRMGDFYEMFFEDALTASRALDLTLTSRQKDATGTAIPMCGIPYHAADAYIGRLIQKGYKVAVCDQVEDAKQAKGIVKREIVRVVTPSTYMHQAYLEEKEASYLMAVAPAKEAMGISLVDLSTGDFLTTELRGDILKQRFDEIVSTYRPRELLYPSGGSFNPEVLTIDGISKDELPRPTTRESWRFDKESGRELLLKHFGVLSLDGYGLEDQPLAIAAAGAALQYLKETQRSALPHISMIRYLEEADYLILDSITQKNLELTRSLTEGGREGSVIAVLDRTSTPMGARLLKNWLLRPLLDRNLIGERLDSVEELAFKTILRAKLRDTMSSLIDLERVLSRITLGEAGPRDFAGLGVCLTRVPTIRGHMSEFRATLLSNLHGRMDPLKDVLDQIEGTLVSEPPANLKDGGIIRLGVSTELDDLRKLRSSGKETLANIETRERQRTGISSLRVRFNRVFGYYIEVTKSKLSRVPDEYIRKQTLVGSERFITPELKEYEEKILNAEERILEIESTLFEQLNNRVIRQATRIRSTAEAISTLDVLSGLAETATQMNYTKPRVHENFELEFRDGRHPVIEAYSTEPFVPNDLSLDKEHFLVILTGPNMGGKSTYLRQTALIVLLAQMGSFVPASEAKVPIVDRIFTRVGASDNLFRGRSTFMVEMQETAHILNHATHKSLILLDEIGRGTSTYDGLSIAWAVAEHIASHSRLGSKTIFATHYHELTDLASEIQGVTNHHVSAREWHEDIVFLRKVVKGGSDRSYGIQVGRLAGLPKQLIKRAQTILSNLEGTVFDLEGRPRLSIIRGSNQKIGSRQLRLFGKSEDRIAAELRKLDLDNMSPLEALQALTELRKKLED